MSDFLAEFLGHAAVGFYVFLIDYLVVQRRDIIITAGRRLQKALRLPDCLCVVLDEDPGLMDDQIREAATIMGGSLLFATIPLLFVGQERRLLVASVVVWNIINPTCATLIVWLLLILEKRRISSLRLQGIVPAEEGVERAMLSAALFV